MGHIMAPGAHRHIFSDLMFFLWKRSLRRPEQMVRDVEADPKGSKDRLSHVFVIEYQAFIYTKSPWVYSSDLSRTELFHASVSDAAIRLWRRRLTRDSLLERLDYIVGSEVPSQHPR